MGNLVSWADFFFGGEDGKGGGYFEMLVVFCFVFLALIESASGCTDAHQTLLPALVLTSHKSVVSSPLRQYQSTGG